MNDDRITDDELAALRAHAPPPWRWSGWNYGDDHFWGRDDLEGSLIAADGQEVLRGVTTEGEDPRVVVLDKSSARLLELAPRLLAEVRRLRSDEWLRAAAEEIAANLSILEDDWHQDRELALAGISEMIRAHRDGRP